VPANHLPGALDPPIPIAATASMRAEGLGRKRLGNGPGYVYAAHRHADNKVLDCVLGSIRFDLTEEDRSVELEAGDRLDLPAGPVHGAVVGPDSVMCLEAHA
jgi:hypothetical protein